MTCAATRSSIASNSGPLPPPAAACGGPPLAEATGAFVVCAVLIVLAGATRAFERVMDKLPMAVAAALLAGVLARFGLDAFLAARTALPLVLLMLGAYLVGRRLWPRYAVPGVLAAGTAFAAANGQLHLAGVAFTLTTPVAVMPDFTLAAMVSLALPLFVVTMASQNLPGVAAIQASTGPPRLSTAPAQRALSRGLALAKSMSERSRISAAPSGAPWHSSLPCLLGEPRPMMVRQMISDGLPVSACAARVAACRASAVTDFRTWAGFS